jgi:hypothetical protein
MQNRETALRVFLEDPAVPLDNNHTERALRVVHMGRRAWMFCWTELGAEHVGIIQSLIVTCKMQGIDPATYLVDVLQRVAIHPASQVEELTPRRWKDLFADNPLFDGGRQGMQVSTLIKFNQKTVTVLTDDGRHRWKVSPQILSPIIEEDGDKANVIELKKKK